MKMDSRAAPALSAGLAAATDKDYDSQRRVYRKMAE
jgi:hypothetical protein